jgi:hypothetical protein
MIVIIVVAVSVAVLDSRLVKIHEALESAASLLLAALLEVEVLDQARSQVDGAVLLAGADVAELSKGQTLIDELLGALVDVLNYLLCAVDDVLGAIEAATEVRDGGGLARELSLKVIVGSFGRSIVVGFGRESLEAIESALSLFNAALYGVEGSD